MMIVTESSGTARAGSAAAPRAIAPAWHTVIVVALVLGPLIQTNVARGSAVAVNAPPSAVPIYIVGAAVQCLFFVVAWSGLRLRGATLRSVIGGRWDTRGDATRDLATAFAFWALWYAVLTGVKAALAGIGLNNAHSTGMIYPNTPVEVALWIPSALLAGVVEEFVFRGYLMRQFAAWTRSPAAGLILQAVLFGVAHSYLLGARQVAVIGVSGLLVGLLVLWRGNLRAAMVFHAWADIFGAAIVRGLPFA